MTHTAARVDRLIRAVKGATYWRHTRFHPLDLAVVTLWRARTVPPRAYTYITESQEAVPSNAIYRKDYDPTRVTVGGLAEAHEAVCARVERGELP